MQEPGLPQNEPDRLATLRSLNILDTPAEDRFDRYTRISARLFDVPIAIISLVDRHRQWFKATAGIDVQETPRSVSFCAHAILGDGVFEIRNTRRDARFRDNPLVLNQPHIHFYAGAPLQAPNGHKLGTLCLIDRVPRRLDDEDKTILGNLADMVVREMVNYVDTETGLANRNAMMIAGAECFDIPPEERRFSLLVFDINDLVSATRAVSDNSPMKKFSGLLRSHFPTAQSIAHMGGNEFAVLICDDESFDESAAIRRVCTEAGELLCAGGSRVRFSALVGRVRYDCATHTCIHDMVHEADGMFVRRERQAVRGTRSASALIERLSRFRKTIF